MNWLYNFFINSPNSPNSNTNKNDINQNVPYEIKYNKQFDECCCEASSQTLENRINELKNIYKQDLLSLKAKQLKLESEYDSDSDSDVFVSDYDAEISAVNCEIIDLKNLLEDNNQIKLNAILEYYNKERLESLEKNTLIENTPFGDVIMVYDSKQNKFAYYSNKSISNKYLESVCKKFCIQFNCKLLFNNLYINKGCLLNYNTKNEVKNKQTCKLSYCTFKEQLK